MGIKRQARECALQILYQLDTASSPSAGAVDDAIRRFFENFDSPDRSREYAEGMVRSVVAARDEIDALIQRHSPRWRVERMALVDRNVLRVGSWELQRDAETPPRVVIDEAVEVAKRFGAEQSAAFVNGVLDGIAREVGRLPAKDAS